MQVRDELEGAIGRGDYEPGDRLPSERQLSEMFGVSRVSVREAIRSLEALGLVEVRQGRATLVVDASERSQSYLARWLELHRDEVLELLFVRGALDELAAASAAASRDSDALARVKEAHAAFATLAGSPDATLDDLTTLDTAFHSAIAEASGVQLLTDLLRELHLQLADSRRVGFQARGRPKRSAREHAAILEAIERHDETQARRAAARHIATVRALLQSQPANGAD
ncbi:MAG: GntR family transcriptional regulator, transcriptional repressor for pyruvate dehydrogenase complex [Thermoleophilaceae bacterium]|nr:GntR family transcriptional regulator, transcriptional repressor for pyruvate dehydrogenase complex [Thermoleophilaceae bacterium]